MENIESLSTQWSGPLSYASVVMSAPDTESDWKQRQQRLLLHAADGNCHHDDDDGDDDGDDKIIVTALSMFQSNKIKGTLLQEFGSGKFTFRDCSNSGKGDSLNKNRKSNYDNHKKIIIICW